MSVDTGTNYRVLSKGGVGQHPQDGAAPLLGNQIESIIEALRAYSNDKLDFGNKTASDGRSAGGGGAGGDAAPGAEVEAAKDAGWGGAHTQAHGNGNQGKGDNKGEGRGRPDGVPENLPPGVVDTTDPSKRPAATSSSSEGGGLGDEMGTLLQILMALLGSDKASEEDKTKILEFLRELQARVQQSGDPQMQEALNSILEEGLEMLKHDEDMSPEDIFSLEEIVNSGAEQQASGAGHSGHGSQGGHGGHGDQGGRRGDDENRAGTDDAPQEAAV